MKKVSLAIAFSLVMVAGFAQKISRINISQTGTIQGIYLLLDDNVTVNLSVDGNISAYGVEVYSDRINSMSRLDPYPGRVENYSQNDNEAFRGKLKYIGRNVITYYGTYDNEAYRGKVKTIGNQTFEYYSNFDDPSVKGKLKNIGPTPFSWYTSFDNEAFKGKVRSIGNTSFAYYASYEDKAYQGKIRTIGNANWTYYASFEKREYAGMVKSGSQFQTINGIKFYIQY